MDIEHKNHESPTSQSNELTGKLGKRISLLKQAAMHGLWSERALWQLEYAYRLSLTDGNAYDELVEEVLSFLEDKWRIEGALTRETALDAEQRLSMLSERAKRDTMLCCAHAHLDINWQWRWDETVAVAVDTFRTMLDLMKEDPEFTFSQSQGALYHAVAKHHPEMISEIRERVLEGRWELTASSWVEADKNIPNGESLVRQMLYSKRYLSSLFNVPEESMDLCFEPDTFGHPANLPEILAAAGVRYYYHCRGTEAGPVYRWRAPSGSELLVLREKFWYNNYLLPQYVMYVPEFCKDSKINTMLKIYGVGNHGGGPTRGDLARFAEMRTWPIFPNLRFGTFREYFQTLEKRKNSWPIVQGELNPIFTGAYTSQARIKMANRKAEGALRDAEMLLAAAHTAVGLKINSGHLEEAWRNVLLSQFHDILPGTCIAEVKDHTLGLFQETMAAATSARTRAIRAIASEIDTSLLIEDSEQPFHSLTHSFDYKGQGAGAGFKIEEFQVSQYEQGWGTKRIFHIFNPSLFKRSEIVELIVWDWPGEATRMVFTDVAGKRVDHQVASGNEPKYWSHSFIRVLLPVQVPAGGYTTYVLQEDEGLPLSLPGIPEDAGGRIERRSNLLLENEHVLVRVSGKTGGFIEFVDKQTGKSLLQEGAQGALFRILYENSKSANAWIVGQEGRSELVAQGWSVKQVRNAPGSLRQWIELEAAFGQSTIRCRYSLDRDASYVDVHAEVDWREFGEPDGYLPQLQFHLPLSWKNERYLYDIPFGTIERPASNEHVSATSWAMAQAPDSVVGVQLITDSKAAFIGAEQSLTVPLIRSSLKPDPYSDIGEHRFQLRIAAISGPGHTPCLLTRSAERLAQPLYVATNKKHGGNLPLEASFFAVSGDDVAITAVKPAESEAVSDKENGNKTLILRVSEMNGNTAECTLTLDRNVVKAFAVDATERPSPDSEQLSITFEGTQVHFRVDPYRVFTLCIKLNK
jgi:alpha-mannosidase